MSTLAEKLTELQTGGASIHNIEGHGPVLIVPGAFYGDLSDLASAFNGLAQIRADAEVRFQPVRIEGDDQYTGITIPPAEMDMFTGIIPSNRVHVDATNPVLPATFLAGRDGNMAGYTIERDLQNNRAMVVSIQGEGSSYPVLLPPGLQLATWEELKDKGLLDEMFSSGPLRGGYVVFDMPGLIDNYPIEDRTTQPAITADEAVALMNERKAQQSKA